MQFSVPVSANVHRDEQCNGCDMVCYKSSSYLDPVAGVEPQVVEPHGEPPAGWVGVPDVVHAVLVGGVAAHSVRRGLNRAVGSVL